MTTKEEIIEAANERNITITFGGVEYPAKLSGSKLDYPIISANKNVFNHDVSTQISWVLAGKLANGEQKTVHF